MLKAHDGNGDENGKREGGRVGLSKWRRRWRWESSNMNDEWVDVGSQCHRERKRRAETILSTRSSRYTTKEEQRERGQHIWMDGLRENTNTNSKKTKREKKRKPENLSADIYVVWCVGNDKSQQMERVGKRKRAARRRQQLQPRVFSKFGVVDWSAGVLNGSVPS